MELRKNIKGFEHYEISNLGNVYNRNGNKMCLNKTNSGYFLIHLRDRGRRKAFLVHRLVAIHFIDNTDNKPHVNHIDGCKTNNNVNNLEWVTPTENMKHAVKKGLVVRGEKYVNNMRNIGIAFREINSQRLREFAKNTSKPVLKLDLEGNILEEYASAKEARRENPRSFGITKVLTGKQFTTGGFKYIHKEKYYENYPLRQG